MSYFEKSNGKKNDLKVKIQQFVDPDEFALLDRSRNDAINLLELMLKYEVDYLKRYGKLNNDHKYRAAIIFFSQRYRDNATALSFINRYVNSEPYIEYNRRKHS